MNKVLAVNKEAKQLKVQAQMTLKNLYDAADAAGLSTPRSALPWWQGLTLGGVFSTASHGTGNNATHMIVSVQQLRKRREGWGQQPLMTCAMYRTANAAWILS